MSTQGNAKVERRLRRLEAARVFIGVAVIVAAVAVVLVGVDAFTDERDAWMAIRLPLFMAVILLRAFARCAKEIAVIESTRTRSKNGMNQPSEPNAMVQRFSVFESR